MSVDSNGCGAVVGQHLCVVTETFPPEINGVAATLSQLVAGMRARGPRGLARAPAPSRRPA